MFAASLEYIAFTSGVGDKIFNGMPTLKGLVEKVNNLPGINEHLARRPKTDY